MHSFVLVLVAAGKKLLQRLRESAFGLGAVIFLGKLYGE